MKYLILFFILQSCSHLLIGKNCNYAYRQIDGHFEKTEFAVCEKP